jgi:hypothetical protein
MHDGMATRFFGDDDSEWTAPASPPTPRVALVIGNGNYRTSRLDNPARDARLIGATLDELGFDTELVIDAGKAVLETAIVRLGERLEKAGSEAVGFFYFAGHGIQHQGTNYLVPVDAQIPDTRYLKSGAVMVDYLVEELARSHALANVVVLDACRDSAVRDSGGGMTQGLASIKDLPDGTLVVFSTAAGQLADDGHGDHSPYAKALVRNLAEPNRRLEEIFFSVSREVAQVTGNVQRPALFVQGAIAPVVLRPAPLAAPPDTAEALPATAARPSAPVEFQTPPVPLPPPVQAGPPPDPENARALPVMEAPVAPPPAAPAPPPPAPVLARPQGLLGPVAATQPVRPAPGRSASQWVPLAAIVAGVVAIGAVVAGLVLRQRDAPVDIASPASWPVARDAAVLWRVPHGEPCPGGWSRVVDGIYCMRSGEPLGAIWESGRLALPLATAMTLKASARTGTRCPDTTVFEADNACLAPVRPDWLSDAMRAGNPMQIDIAGPLAGEAELTPRTTPGCSASAATAPFSGYCLTGAARFGAVTPTVLGHDRLSGTAPANAIRLAAYRRLTTCPRLTTLLENDEYCLVGPLW